MPLITGCYLAYLAIPVALLLVGSFGGNWTNTLLPSGATTRWYAEILADGSFRRAFSTSLITCAATCAVTALSCAGCAMLLKTACSKVEGAQVNGDAEHRLPNTSNLAFEGIDSEGALMLLDQHHICCSSGSACTTGSVHASHVLKAMGFSDERARASLRFSFSRFNTERRGGKSAGDSPEGHRQAAPHRRRGIARAPRFSQSVILSEAKNR